MSPFRYRDDDSSVGRTVMTTLLGAVAGFAVGMYVAQRVGGFDGLTARFRKGTTGAREQTFRFSGDEYDEIDSEETDLDDVYAASEAADDEPVGDDVPLLEERVLEAFNNDPVLAERAIDIGAIGSGTIELAGWVESDDEAEHAITVARGVPDVENVVNRLMIEDEERQIDDNRRRFTSGDPALTESRWEGQQVGTGKRRQGTSDEFDRHADPKPALEDRWLSEQEAVRNAAEEIEVVRAERRSKRGKSNDQPTA